ncbi:MAG: nucleoside hydrolase [Chloroflexota bacterium]|nr:nucleoside hydrolase [Ardenticatenaceae bacterium]GIK56306.1 MAG: nucleoside hydrolase [Chloroflexota bacterium]
MTKFIKHYLAPHGQNETWKPNRYRIVVLLLAALVFGAMLVWLSSPAFATSGQVRLVIDTDGGVDDAAAIAWLLSQRKYTVEVLGISTVAGSTTTENAANNVLTILEAVGRADIPVVIGAHAPLSQTLTSTGALTHGPDGLWFVGWSNPHDLSGLPTDAPDFLCSNAATDVQLVTLGPLTNVAAAVALCPEQMALYDQIVILGGAKHGGNVSPLAEFNIWVDPEAADQVFTAGLMPTFVPYDTFHTFTLRQEDINKLAANGTPVGQLLAVALQPYADVQTGLGGASTASVPDVTAVMVTLDRNLFVQEEQTALLKMVPGIVGEPDPHRLVRGQTIIGLTVAEKVPMIADDVQLSSLAQRAFTEPGFDLATEIGMILFSEPDNTTMVLDIRERPMRKLFMRSLTD